MPENAALGLVIITGKGPALESAPT